MKRRYDRTHPDMHLIRRKTNLVCGAVQQLNGMGIEVINIDLTTEPAVIEVMGTVAVRQLHGDGIGQRCNGANKQLLKAAFFCGCAIHWSENA